MAKILIIEDDKFYSKIYRKKFEVEGFQVETATDGEDGLTKMKSFQPDVVMLDIMMPKLDGFDVLEKVKADPQISHLPIIMMTNLSTQEDIDKALKNGAISYIVKSDFTPSQVVNHVKQKLNITTTPAAAPAATAVSPKAA